MFFVLFCFVLFCFLFCFVLFCFCPNFILTRVKNIFGQKFPPKNFATPSIYIHVSTELFLTFVINFLFLKMLAFFFFFLLKKPYFQFDKAVKSHFLLLLHFIINILPRTFPQTLIIMYNCFVFILCVVFNNMF